MVPQNPGLRGRVGARFGGRDRQSPVFDVIRGDAIPSFRNGDVTDFEIGDRAWSSGRHDHDVLSRPVRGPRRAF